MPTEVNFGKTGEGSREMDTSIRLYYSNVKFNSQWYIGILKSIRIPAYHL